MALSPTSSPSSTILNALGSGSGIDIGALTTSLVEAQFAAKKAQLDARSETLTAQISGVATLKSAITGFNVALKSLVAGGSLATAPTSSDAKVMTVSAEPGAKLSGLNAAVGVTQLASAQAATTNTAVSRTAAYRTGTLTLRVGTWNGNTLNATSTTAVTIGAGDNTIVGIAAKINEKTAQTGLTATVINDGAGARLTVKGRMGAAQAFEITGSNSGGGPFANGISLATLAVNRNASGTTIGSDAKNAVLTLDGATYTRPTNEVTDLIPGVKMTLTGIGATTLAATAPTAAIGETAGNFVATYNEMLAVLKEETNRIDGPLRSETSVTIMQRALARLTTTPLIPGTTGPRTLADIGVETARNGTLSVDAETLKKALADYPNEVEAMFAAGTGASNGGLSAALDAITTQVTSPIYGFDAATLKFNRAKSNLANAQLKVTEATERATDRLTRQFSGMDARVAAYKSTQSFLENQIKAWNSDN